MGIGHGKGKTRAVDAAMSAISSPLLDFPISKARGIVFNIVGGPDMTLQEINSAAEVVYEAVDADANIIFGALIDESIIDGEVRFDLKYPPPNTCTLPTLPTHPFVMPDRFLSYRSLLSSIDVDNSPRNGVPHRFL